MRLIATRTPFTFASIAGVCLALMACGDTTAPGGGGAGGGGSPSTGGTPNVGGRPNEGGGGGTGGTGGAPGAAVGSSCGADTDCAGSLCLTEGDFGWAGGYCSALCDPNFAPCEEGTCVFTGGQSSVCLKECDVATDCPGVANDCIDINGDGSQVVCLGGCDMDSQCQSACDNDNLVCVSSGEVCDNNIDDDGDGLFDCAEVDCAADTTCVAGISGACADATVLTAGVPVDGTTSDGTNLFEGVCSSLFGAFVTGAGHENLYSFTAPGKGILTVTAHSITADVGLYIRSSCDDATTEVDCEDNATMTGEDEVSLPLSANAGDSFIIFVDAYDGTTEGDYTITADFEAEVCGDGVVVGAEQCDDSNTTAGDGCSATCQVEPAQFCAIPTNVTTVLAGVPVVSDNSTGTAGFQGSCGGAGNEKIFEYVPLTTGTVTITEAAGFPAFDGVLYVRTACADEASEIAGACTDTGFGGDDESLDVAVTVGTPIFIFADSYASGTAGAFTLTVN